MRWHADRQPLRLAGARLQRQLCHFGHGFIASGDYNLRFGVEVGEIDLVALHQRLNPRAGQAHNRRQPVTFRIGLLHEIAAQGYQPQRAGEIERAGNDRCGKGADGEAADHLRINALAL